MAGSLSSGTDGTPAAPYVARRTVEVWTAVAGALIGVVVVSESLTHDIGWNETGPGSGYFPFRIGVLLIGAAMIRVLQVRLKPDTTTAFVTREELGRSLSVLWPTVALVAAMIPLGCYVPSAVYLAWMMRRHGGYSWLLSAAYGVAIAVAFFLVFDLWFRVPLAKGPVEAALGLY
jgi:putative tricarboxylic transport membrane protein